MVCFRLAAGMLVALTAHLVFAQDNSNLPLSNVPAYTALVKGLRVTIPDEDRKSASFILQPGSVDHAAVLNVILREQSFRPILTPDDERDWRANWLKPYATVDASHRWVVIAFIPTISNGPNSNAPADQFKRLSHDKRLTNLVCRGLKYGLSHCVGEVPEEIDFPNEFFFDSQNEKTLIACSNIPRLDFRHCTHYFVADALNSIAQLAYSAEEQIVMWKSTENRVNHFVLDFAIW